MVELAVYQKAFPGDELLTKLIKAELNCKSKTASGHKYDPNGSRLSGSPLTTDGNTLIATFVDYCALRLQYGPEQSWALLGRHYGDDSLCQGRIEDLQQTAADLGLNLKVEEKRDSVTYLGREFPRPMDSTDSFQVATRVWPRLGAHTNDAHPDPVEAMARKLRGYLATDSKTPILANYCRKFLALSGRAVDGPASVGYISSASGGAWPQSDAITMAEYAASLGMTTEQAEALDATIAAATALGDLVGIYHCEPAALGGTINSYSCVAPVAAVSAGTDRSNNLVLSTQHNAPQIGRAHV